MSEETGLQRLLSTGATILCMVSGFAVGGAICYYVLVAWAAILGKVL